MGKCKYYDVCPSATGWCLNRSPDAECAGLVIGMYQRLKEQKPVLVVKPKMLMRAEDTAKLRDRLAADVQTGVVVLPLYCEAEYTPPGLIVKVEDDGDEE